jgi:hypothetical protein
MRPSASASATSRFGRPVSTPAKCPSPSSTSRQAKPSLRRAMRGHLAAVFQRDVGEETLIPSHEGAADQGRREAHRDCLDHGRDEDKPDA